MRGSDDMVVMMPQKKNWQKELLAYSLYGRRKGSYEERGRAHQVSLILFFNRLRDWPKVVNTARPNSAVVNAVRANQVNVVKASACWVWRPTKLNSNMSYLSYFKELKVKYVTFGGGAKGGRITSKGTLKTGKLDFEDVYFVKELQLTFLVFHRFTDESQVLLKVPRKNNMYSVDMKNIVPKESLTCLVAKATLDESILWHRRLGHINFKTINKLVKDNLKCIKREFGILELSAKGVAERESRTLIEAARTMLANSKLPTTFWAEVVNTACYVHNKVLVVKPYNETPHELFRGRTPALSFMRQFGCHVTILNTLDHLGKFDGKSDDGFFVGYTLNSTNSNDFVGTKESIDAGQSSKETRSSQDYILMPLWKDGSLDGLKTSAQDVNTAGPNINTASINTGSLNINNCCPTVITAPLEATHVDFFGDETEVDMSNITNTYPVPSTLNIRIHKDHPLEHVIGNVQSGVQTRRITNEQGADTCSRRGGVQDSSCMAATIGCVRLIGTFGWGWLIGLSQTRYVDEILEKFAYSTCKKTSTPIETSKPLLKDAEAEDVDVHLYRSMIGSLMYLTASRPASNGFSCMGLCKISIQPKRFTYHDVKEIFRYLKVNLNWAFGIPKDSHLTWKLISTDYAVQVRQKSIIEVVNLEAD
ncbi:putative ribonuclease H-like domain-containing protein [Tanacetum coccineum]|uniref:Ribonuclease H-like domain-containing protein n=1 Tax=Tanacetum coccineum TaxID=301880 RepID=A0ABQ5ETM0_9ASTR